MCQIHTDSIQSGRIEPNHKIKEDTCELVDVKAKTLAMWGVKLSLMITTYDEKNALQVVCQGATQEWTGK